MERMLNDMGDILRAAGIYRYGYGTISKIVMIDRQLSISAKGLYVYLCSYANTGDVAFPFRQKIITDLGLSINTFYKYMNELIDRKYITKEQQKKGTKFSYNIYTIMQTIPYEEYLNISMQNNFSVNLPECIPYIDIDILGYGKIPKVVTTDNELSVKSKALFGFIASNNQWLNTDLCCWKNLCDIMKVSKTTFYKSINDLIQKGYIIEYREESKKGYDKPIYYVNTMFQT